MESTDAARGYLPDWSQESQVLDGIVAIVGEMAEALRAAAAEPA